jgi:hypothetical protein
VLEHVETALLCNLRKVNFSRSRHTSGV